MKLQIDLSNSLPLKGQLLAVDEYIRSNMKPTNRILMKARRVNTFDGIPNIETTPKDTGLKVETDFGNYRVSCHKTKGGLYKFKTWRAI